MMGWRVGGCRQVEKSVPIRGGFDRSSNTCLHLFFFFHALLIDRAHPPFPPFPRQTFIDTGKDIITISSIFLNGTQISSLAKEEGEFFPKTDSQFINNGTSP